MADLTGMLQAAAGTAASSGYEIERSLRFNSADSAYLSRSFSYSTRTKQTFSCWVKRSYIGSNKLNIVSAYDGSSTNSSTFAFNADALQFLFGGNTTIGITTTQLFRDPSAWYHVVLAIDTTQATSTERIKLYVNGSQITSFSSASYPTQNADCAFGANASNNKIGTLWNHGSEFFNGYLADFYFIQDQALTPSDFGETDATTGVWKPKEYAGTYGTNGFYLPFSDNTSTTTLGYDAAGSNDWTPNNFSVTAGVGNDSLVDTPTPYGDDTGAGGEVRGNYCTLNALANGGTLSNGNLQFTQGASHALAKSTFAVPTTGLWYAEATVTTLTGGSNAAGFGLGTAALSTTAVASSAAGAWEIYASSSIFFNRNATQTSIAGTFAANDVIQIAVDLANSRAWVGKNNTWYDGSNGTTGDPATGANPTFTSLPSELFVICNTYSNTLNANFGQRSFAHAAPAGFKALCTQNLEEGTITTSGTFTGNGSTNGPFVFLNGVPTAMTIDGNAVTFGTHADKLANGFKVRSSSASYNANATSMSYTISTTGAKFKYANAQLNP